MFQALEPPKDDAMTSAISLLYEVLIELYILNKFPSRRFGWNFALPTCPFLVNINNKIAKLIGFTQHLTFLFASFLFQCSWIFLCKYFGWHLLQFRTMLLTVWCAWYLGFCISLNLLCMPQLQKFILLFCMILFSLWLSNPSNSKIDL